MADKWMDERERRWRERDRRRPDEYGRGGESRYPGGEDRSWAGPDESVGSYGAEDAPRGGRYAESFGRPEGRYGGGRGSAYRSQSRHPAWQDRDYGGVSPAMEQGEYEAERQAERYGQGGRFYGDAGRERIFREEYGHGGRQYGEVPSGYDAERERWRGEGGYGYERGYRDPGLGRYAGRWARGGREAGDFFRQTGERLASWFGSNEVARRDCRGMGPKGYKRSDERISDEVHERLTDDAWLDASNIEVAVAAGEVTLSGLVENRESKHRAEHCVENVTGVCHVQNNLRVDLSAGRGGGYESVLERQTHGETGAGESIEGALAARESGHSGSGKPR